MKRIIRSGIKVLVILGLLSIPVMLATYIATRPPKSIPYVPPKSANVEVFTVARGVLDDDVVLPMCAEATEGRFVRISSETAGVITWLGPKEGEVVKAGDVVMRIDAERLDAEVAEAKAGYVEAQQRFERINQLYEGSHISKDQLDAARAAKDRAAAALQLCEVNLKRATVTSPIGGTVDRRYVEQGEYVQVGAHAFDIVDLTRLYAVVDVPEKDRMFVKRDQQVELLFENVASLNPGRPFVVPDAVVRSVSDMGSNVTRTYRTKIEFANPDGRVKPGMLGTARIRRRSISDVILVPKDFIVASESEKLVYVAINGRAIARRVELGFTDGRQFSVLSGVEAGEQIIRDPRQLTPGAPISVTSVDGVPVPAGADETAGGR